MIHQILYKHGLHECLNKFSKCSLNFSAFKRGKINRYTQSVGPLQLLRVCQEIVGNKGMMWI